MSRQAENKTLKNGTKKIDRRRLIKLGGLSPTLGAPSDASLHFELQCSFGVLNHHVQSFRQAGIKEYTNSRTRNVSDHRNGIRRCRRQQANIPGCLTSEHVPRMLPLFDDGHLAVDSKPI